MPSNVSFLPEDYLEKRIARRTNIICISLFVVVMGCVLAVLLVTDRQRSEIRDEQAAVNQQYIEAAQRLEQLEKLQAQKQQMVRKAKLASVLVERVPRTLVLSEMINHMPGTLSLLDFEMETEVVRTAAAPRTALQREAKKAGAKAMEEEFQVPETRVSLRMVGVAPTDVEVAQFITALNSHSLFSNVTLEFSETAKIEETEMRKFSLHVDVNQGVDMRHVEPTLVRRELKMNPMGGSVEIGAGALPPVLPAVDH